MPENEVLPTLPLSRLGITKRQPGAVTITIAGSDQLAQEVVRARAVDAIASTLGSLGTEALDAAAFEFGLVIKL